MLFTEVLYKEFSEKILLEKVYCLPDLTKKDMPSLNELNRMFNLYSKIFCVNDAELTNIKNHCQIKNIYVDVIDVNTLGQKEINEDGSFAITRSVLETMIVNANPLNYDIIYIEIAKSSSSLGIINHNEKCLFNKIATGTKTKKTKASSNQALDFESLSNPYMNSSQYEMESNSHLLTNTISNPSLDDIKNAYNVLKGNPHSIYTPETEVDNEDTKSNISFKGVDENMDEDDDDFDSLYNRGSTNAQIASIDLSSLSGNI